VARIEPTLDRARKSFVIFAFDLKRPWLRMNAQPCFAPKLKKGALESAPPWYNGALESAPPCLACRDAIAGRRIARSP
jgi:hypothetical protein